MTLLEIEQETFKDLVHHWRQRILGTEPIERLREKGWDQFDLLGLPNRTQEAFRSIKLRAFYSNHYEIAKEISIDSSLIASLVLPECQGASIVFVNGYYRSDLSCIEALPSKVVICSIQDAFSTYGAFLNNHLNKTLKEETDPFAALNAALHPRGTFIYIPPKTVVETPIQILNIIDSSHDAIMVTPRLQLFAGTQACVTLAMTTKYLGDKGVFFNQVTDFVLDEAADVRFYQLESELNPLLWSMDSCRASLKRDSRFKTVVITEGAACVRHDYRVSITGQNAEALLNGIALLSDKRESHTHIFMEHQAPHCRSYQHFKAVLNHFARSGFEGKIMVRREAQKTEAFQLNNHLLLSDHARADSKPNLEIFADDVKASHGSTVGQLDTDQLFYMKTRGFQEEEAKNLLIYGFCQEMIQSVPIPSLVEKASIRARYFLK